VADVFFGAIGVLIIIIVLSSKQTEDRVVEAFDRLALCSGTSAASLRLRDPASEDAVAIADWLAALPTDRFMLRLGIRPENQDLTCVGLTQQAAFAHNQKLEQRGATQAVLSVLFWRGSEASP